MKLVTLTGEDRAHVWVPLLVMEKALRFVCGQLGKILLAA